MSYENRLPAPDEMEARHPAGGLEVPRDIDELPTLKAAPSDFVAPKTVYCMDYFLRAKDQGKNPWCAGYASAAFLENIQWRRDDVPKTEDPAWIYKWAKLHDGMPNVDGTTLTAALDALLDHGCFDKERCGVKVLRTPEQVKYAIHKFGCCLLGMNITKEWYACNHKKTAIYGQKGCDLSSAGGHAVVAGGMDRSGILILNSWGEEWASYGRALVTWDEFAKQFLYGAVVNNCMADVRVN